MAGKDSVGHHCPGSALAGREGRAIHRERHRAVALLTALAAFVGLTGLPPATAQETGPSVLAPLRVRVGEQLILRAPAGVIHAEAADPSIAAVTMPSSDTIVVQGIRPANTVLLLVNSTTVVAQALLVSPPLVLAGTTVGAQSPVGFVDLTYIPQTQAFWADVHRPGLDATFSSGGWQVQLISGTLAIVGASALQTPLQNFGVAPGWGTSVRTADGWEVIGSSTQSQLVYHWRLGGPNEVALAATAAGPLATLHLERSGVGVEISALSQNGGTQAAGVVTATIGRIPVAYTFGPQGGGLSAQIPYGGWTISAASGPQGVQVGLAGKIGVDNHLNLWWGGQGGYGLGVTLPLGPAGVVTVSGNAGAYAAVINTSDNPAAGVTSTMGFGAGELTVTNPPPDFPMLLTSAVPSRLSPLQTMPGTYPVTPYFVRARVEIPAERITAVGGAGGSSGTATAAAPVSIPSGSAALIVHVCLHSGSPRTTCDPGDPTIAIRLYVDDRPIEMTGIALPIAPGPHTISIHPEDLPPFLVPLGTLSCPINPTTGGIVVCDFAFRRAGNP